MFWLKRKKMAAPDFTCAASATAKRKLLGIPEEGLPGICELKRENTMSRKELDEIDPPLPHLKEHPSDTEIEDRAIEAFSPVEKPCYGDNADEQTEETHRAAHEEMTVQQCRDFLRTLPGYSYPCECEACDKPFQGIDPAFILCPSCEDEYTEGPKSKCAKLEE
jgi:hypothetical protein